MLLLKATRQQIGLSQLALAKEVGVSRSTIAMWESGGSQPDIDMVLRLSQVLNVSVGELLGEDTDTPSSDPTWINVLGRVAAGIPIEAIEEVIGREQITEAMARSGTYIGLQIHGSSMEPRMREGDVVIVRLQDDCESGDTVVAMVNGDEATCKILQRTPDGISLLSTNPVYPPMFFTNEEIESKPVRLIGKVVELRAKF